MWGFVKTLLMYPVISQPFYLLECTRLLSKHAYVIEETSHCMVIDRMNVLPVFSCRIEFSSISMYQDGDGSRLHRAAVDGFCWI